MKSSPGASAAAGGDYQIHVIPLLVESGRADAYDRVLVVDCPEEAQIARLMARDGTSRAQAEEILAAQASREERLNAAHDVIENTGTLADLQGFVADPASELRAARAEARRLLRQTANSSRHYGADSL